MTDYTAYNAGLPCTNPNCSSYGTPHPNCKCYSGGGEEYMAKGGQISLCDIKHLEDCQYYAVGGDVIDPSKVQMDPQPTQDIIDPNKVQIDEIDPNEVVMDKPTGKYETPSQQLITGVEGAAQGFAGPLATLFETKVLGIPEEDIVGRQEANPVIHGASEAATMIGGLLIGTGEAALAAKLAAQTAKVANMGKVGTFLIKGGIESGLIQASDEVSKAILGQGDPEDAVAPYMHIGAASLFGIGGSVVGKGLEASAKYAKNLPLMLDSFAKGFGSAAAQEGDEAIKLATENPFARKWFNKGTKVFERYSLPAVASAFEAYHDYKEGGITGAVKGAFEGYLYGLAGKQVVDRIAAPTILKILSSGKYEQAYKYMDKAFEIQNGANAISKSINSLFDKTPSLIGEGSSLLFKENERQMKALDKYIRSGGINAELDNTIIDPGVPGYAQGGDVQSIPKAPLLEDNGFDAYAPEQNLLVQSAKARISGYLTSLMPQDPMGQLPFDDKPDLRNAEQSYNSALSIAAHPLKILHEIKEGTLDPDNLKHFTALYPELKSYMEKEMTKTISANQVDGKEPPSYKIRQGLSAFMGVPLDGTLTQQNMISAQSTFMKQKAQNQQQAQQGTNKAKKGTAPLKNTATNHLTADQANIRKDLKST